MNDLCLACLCAGRNLYLLTETDLYSIYEQILNEVADPRCRLQVSVHVCWECRALLRRFQRFRQQVKSCFIELMAHSQQVGGEAPRARTPRLQMHREQSHSVPAQESPGSPSERLDSDVASIASLEETTKRKARVVKAKRKRGRPRKPDPSDSVEAKPPADRLGPYEPTIEDVTVEVEPLQGSDWEQPEHSEEARELRKKKTRTKKKMKVEKASRRERCKEALPEKPTCADCGKSFSSRKTYRYHRNVLHRGQNRYPCPRCGKVYQWSSNLGRHMRTHKARDTGELYCEKCDKSFASVATYRQHLRNSRRHVPESDYSFMCNECGKKFVNKTRLRDHIDWEHLKKVKYRCQICNNAFKCHTTLYVHMQNLHTNKERKNNLCHVCGKSYQNASKLKYHIVAMHTRETPYRCAQCDAKFGWYSSLHRHVREVHYGMKVPAKTAKKSKKLLRDLLMHPAGAAAAAPGLP